MPPRQGNILGVNPFLIDPYLEKLRCRSSETGIQAWQHKYASVTDVEFGSDSEPKENITHPVVPIGNR